MKTLIKNVAKIAGLFDIIQFDEFGGYAVVIVILFQVAECLSGTQSLFNID